MVRNNEKNTFLVDLLAQLTGDVSNDFFPENYKIKCSDDLTRDIGVVLSSVLKKLYLGGIDNTKITTEETRTDMVIANYLCCILLNSNHDIDEASIEQFVGWFLLNNVDKKKTTNYRSYTSQRFIRLSTNVQSLVEAIVKKSKKLVTKISFNKYREIKEQLKKIRNAELFNQIENTLLRGFKAILFPLL